MFNNTDSDDPSRRDFIRISVGAGLAAGFSGLRSAHAATAGPGVVHLVKGGSRAEMISQLLGMVGLDYWRSGISGKKVVIKPNCNSAHAFPGGSHPETVDALTAEVSRQKPASATIIDRSGMGDTQKVMRELGLFEIAAKHGATALYHEEIGAEDMVKFELGGGHWSRGVEWPRLYTEAESIVQTCCLKTHQYGGHFTLSLKNSVGMVNKYDSEDGYNYMRELHSSADQRRMIAEINLLYQPHLVIMDASKCFIDGGPHVGTEREPGVMLASTDRVALDAVGVAILRHYGTTSEVQNGPVFQQEQLKRAAELEIGVSSASDVKINTNSEAARAFAAEIGKILTS